MPGYYDALIMEPIISHKRKVKKGKKTTQSQPPSPPIQAEEEAVNVNNDADESTSDDINIVSGSIIPDAATETQSVAMSTVPTGKKAKKAAKKGAALAKKATEASVQPVQPTQPPSSPSSSYPPSLTEEDALNVITDGDGYSSDETNLSIVSGSFIVDGATEESRMTMSVAAQQERLSKGARKKAAVRSKKLAARGDAGVDTNFNTAIVTAAITKIVFASTLFGYGASHFVPKAASFIFVKEHILSGSAILAALFLVLDVSFANIVTNCRTCVRTIWRFVDARDREELRKLVACSKKLCVFCGKALLEAVVDVADDLPGSIGFKWVKSEEEQEVDENEGYEAEDEQTEL